jgi:putative ABC transport system permease protein
VSFIETIRMAASALAANRARSILTVLSITIGAFAIVMMSSLAESGLNTLKLGIEQLGGARMILVWSKTPEKAPEKANAYTKGIRPVDAQRVVKDLPHVAEVAYYAEVGDWEEVMTDHGLRTRTSVIGGDANFFKAFAMPLAEGRLFSDEDVQSHAPICVVGKELAEKIFPSPEKPIGSLVSVTVWGLNVRCRVVGVLQKTQRFGMRFGFDWSNLIVVPIGLMNDTNPNVSESGVLFIKTDGAASNDIVKRLVSARMEQRHPGVDDFTILDFSSIMAQNALIFSVIELIVAVLAGIALFVGGVGVMNMMLVAVSERVKEIGLRKALGASPRAIGTQFIIESAMLSVFGGVVGVVLGLGAALGASAIIIKQFASWQGSLAFWSVTAALIVTLLIGIGFGWLPARRAAALDPVEAMRQ